MIHDHSMMFRAELAKSWGVKRFICSSLVVQEKIWYILHFFPSQYENVEALKNHQKPKLLYSSFKQFVMTLCVHYVQFHDCFYLPRHLFDV